MTCTESLTDISSSPTLVLQTWVQTKMCCSTQLQVATVTAAQVLRDENWAFGSKQLC